MKQIRRTFLAVVTAGTILTTSQSQAEPMGGQVFYRYGFNMLANDRGGQVFTDTLGTSGKNDGKGGWNIGAGLDLPLAKDLGPGVLLGEVMATYARFSKKSVLQTTSHLVGGSNKSKVAISQLQVVIAPKYQLSFMEGKLRPWIIPAGLGFLVNSPPSDDTNYLDIGLHLGAGVEYMICSLLSVGVDYRHTFAAKEPGLDMTGGQLDRYVGVNF